MKTRTKPIAPAPSLALARWVYRAWLRSRIDTYTRSLHGIVAQRENDFHPERLLHRAISATRARLQSM